MTPARAPDSALDTFVGAAPISCLIGPPTEPCQKVDARYAIASPKIAGVALRSDLRGRHRVLGEGDGAGAGDHPVHLERLAVLRGGQRRRPGVDRAVADQPGQVVDGQVGAHRLDPGPGDQQMDQRRRLVEGAKCPYRSKCSPAASTLFQNTLSSRRAWTSSTGRPAATLKEAP